MYIPSHHQETDLVVLHSLIEAHPLGAWVSLQDGELVANHIPFLLDRGRGPHGTLVGHVARANPVWRSFSRDRDSLVIFQGVNSYITPSWYPSKREHGKAVPTWNYVVVHAYGRPVAIEDPAWLIGHLTGLSARHESGQPVPWTLDDAPRDFIERLVDAIVGIEIPLTSLQGKWKVSQNRPESDKVGIIEGLRGLGTEAAKEMAARVGEHLAPSPR